MPLDYAAAIRDLANSSSPNQPVASPPADLSPAPLDAGRRQNQASNARGLPGFDYAGALKAFPVPEPDRPWTSDAYEVGRQAFGAGPMVHLPRMVGQATKALSPVGSAPYKWGEEVVQGAEARAPEWEPDMRGRGPVAAPLIEAAGQLAPSVAAPLAVGAGLAGAAALGAAAPAAVGLGLAAGAGGAFFGAGQYQDTYEAAKAAGADDEAAKSAARKAAAYETAGETVANVAGLKLAGIGGRAIGKAALGMAGKGVANATETGILRPFAKAAAVDMAVEPTTEAVQAWGERGAEQEVGVPGESPWQSALHGAKIGAAMTTLMLPLGIGGHAVQARRAQNRLNALSDPSAPPVARNAAAMDVFRELQATDKDAATEWLVMSNLAVHNNLPIDPIRWADDYDARSNAAQSSADSQVAVQNISSAAAADAAEASPVVPGAAGPTSATDAGNGVPAAAPINAIQPSEIDDARTIDGLSGSAGIDLPGYGSEAASNNGNGAASNAGNEEYGSGVANAANGTPTGGIAGASGGVDGANVEVGERGSQHVTPDIPATTDQDVTPDRPTGQSAKPTAKDWIDALNWFAGGSVEGRPDDIAEAVRKSAAAEDKTFAKQARAAADAMRKNLAGKSEQEALAYAEQAIARQIGKDPAKFARTFDMMRKHIEAAQKAASVGESSEDMPSVHDAPDKWESALEWFDSTGPENASRAVHRAVLDAAEKIDPTMTRDVRDLATKFANYRARLGREKSGEILRKMIGDMNPQTLDPVWGFIRKALSAAGADKTSGGEAYARQGEAIYVIDDHPDDAGKFTLSGLPVAKLEALKSEFDGKDYLGLKGGVLDKQTGTLSFDVAQLGDLNDYLRVNGYKSAEESADDFDELDGRYASAMSKDEVSALLPFALQGNKSHLLAESIGKLVESASSGGRRFIDAFGGAGRYTHYLAHNGKLPTGSILNEFDPMRSIAHKQIQKNPEQVRATAMKLADYVRARIAALPSEEHPKERLKDALKLRDELGLWAKGLLRRQIAPGQNMEEKAKSGQPVEMIDNPFTAGLYYFLQRQTYSSLPLQSDASVKNIGDIASPGFNFIVPNNATGKVDVFNRKNDHYDKLSGESKRLSGVDVRRGDGWALTREEAGEGDTVAIDTSYLNRKGSKIKTANYNKATEEDANPDVYLEKIEKNVLPAWDRGARLIITNQWHEDVADALASQGFKVYKTHRSSALGKKNEGLMRHEEETGEKSNAELVAINFDPKTNRVFSRGEAMVHVSARRASERIEQRRSRDADEGGPEGLADRTPTQGGRRGESGQSAAGRRMGQVPDKDLRRRLAKLVNPQKDSLLAAIAKLGGVSGKEAKQQGIDPANLKKRTKVFTRKGKTFDDMAHNVLRHYGYPVTGANDLLDAIEKELRGTKVFAPEGAINDFVSRIDDETSWRDEAAADGEASMMSDEEAYYQYMPPTEDSEAPFGEQDREPGSDDDLIDMSQEPVENGAENRQDDLKFSKSPRVRMTVAQLVEAAEGQKTWRHWYDEHKPLVAEVFGEDATLFEKMLVATSQAATVPANVAFALKAYEQAKAGKPFSGFVKGAIKNLERLMRGEPMQGPKISEYEKAIDGDENAIAVDRHIAMLFFDEVSPTAAQVASAKARIISVAKAMGWKPREVQAALWAYNQVRMGKDPSKVESYEPHLERRRAEIAARRDAARGVRSAGSSERSDSRGQGKNEEKNGDRRSLERRNDVAGGQTAQSLRAEIAQALGQKGERIVSALERAGFLRIVQGQQELLATQSGIVRGMYDGKAVTLVADNIPRGEAFGTFLHEAGGHMAMPDLLGKDAFSRLSKDFQSLLKAGDPIARKVEDHVQSLLKSGEMKPEHADEERIAYAVEYATNRAQAAARGSLPSRFRAFVARVVSALRAALYRSPIGKWLSARGFALTPQDMAALARAAVAARADAVERSEAGKSPKSAVGKLGNPQKRLASQDAKFRAPEVRDAQGRLLAPNGKPSKLNEMQWHQVRSPQFMAWFGDWENDPKSASKVVDENGEPLVLYHGTGADFSVFSKLAKPKHIPLPGFFFAPNPEWASRFAESAGKEFRDEDGYIAGSEGANVFPVFINLKNPLVLDASDGVNKGFVPASVIDEILRDAQRYGQDGAIISGWKDGSGDVQYVVFNPNQIKSAIGNTGAFSPNNPDIRYSIRSIIGDSGRTYDAGMQDSFDHVGRTRVEKNWREKLADLRKIAGKSLVQGIADQFAPIKELSDHAYTLMRTMGNGTAGAFEALLRYGALSVGKDGAYDADTSGGVIEKVFLPLGKESTDFLYWIAANRAERLQKEDREHLFRDQDIEALKRLNEGRTDFDYTLANGQTTRDRKNIYDDALAKYVEVSKNVMDMAEKSGLIDGETRHIWEHEFYVPFWRVAEEEDGGVMGMDIKSGVVRQEAFKRLKGGKEKLGDLLENTLMNWAHLIDAAAKNRAAKAALEAAENAGVARRASAGAKKSVWYMGRYTTTIPAGQKYEENGVEKVSDGAAEVEVHGKIHYTVSDPYVMTAITGLHYAGLRGPIMDALSGFKHVLTLGVTASPFFKTRNLVRDSVHSVATGQGMSYNVAGNVAKGWKLTEKSQFKADQIYVSALASGALIRFGTMWEGNESARTRQLVKLGNKPASILDSKNKVDAFFAKMRDGTESLWSRYQELGNRGEEINRMALFAKLHGEGVGNAKAALESRDLMDFALRGSFQTIRFLTQVVPFMNARIQGLYKLGRAAKSDTARMAYVVGMASLYGIALAAIFHDDDDWKKREDWDKQTYWWFKIGGTAYRIPKPFEIGAAATMAEYGFEKMISDNVNGERIRRAFMSIVLDQLAMNPTPQLAKPLIDLYANHDSFTGRPIESMGMERLLPSHRVKGSTSSVARGISSAGNAATGERFLSPVQIDHLIHGYLSWVGIVATTASDAALRPLMDDPERPAIDELKRWTGGMVAKTEGAPSRYVTEMYRQAKRLEQAYGTWSGLMKQGKVADARKFYADHQDEIRRYRSVEHVKATETKINARIRQIEANRSMGADAKRQEIDRLRKIQDRTARLAVE